MDLRVQALAGAESQAALPGVESRGSQNGARMNVTDQAQGSARSLSNLGQGQVLLIDFFYHAHTHSNVFLFLIPFTDAQPEAPGRLSSQSPQKGFLCLLSQPNPSSPKEGMVPEGWQAKMLEARAICKREA